MDFDVPVKDGPLLFPPHGILKKKTWHKKYCKLFKASKHGIERLEVFDTDDDANKNKCSLIITLENSVKITPSPQKHQKNAFTIFTKTLVQDLAAQSTQEMQEWITAFQAVAFKGEIASEDFEEDNDLYCSSGEGVFTVTVVPTPASTRCGLSDGNYTLVVTNNALQLRSLYPNECVLYTWPFMYIRKYGYKSGLFTFEAGRKCGSGEGTFQLENQQQQEIYKCISMSMKSWRKSFYKDDAPLSPHITSPPGIACGDSQFQAALNMEPGSRTPLPPSPTTQSTTLFNELTLAIENSCVKQKPTKPPRTKNIASEIVDPVLYQTFIQEHQMDTVPSNSCYDDIVFRSEAWRTLGIGEMTHTEHIRPEEKAKPKVIQIPTLDETVQVSRKILYQPTTDASEDYDTLQHFGGSQPVSIKSAISSNSLYRQITPQITTPIAPQAWQDFSVNQYDTIEDVCQSVRPADDSHQGYGVIRKPPPPQSNPGEEYATVLKPKKV